MSNYLIDTHVFLWSLNEPSKLSGEVADILKDTTNTIHVSAAVTWEVVIKRAKGTLKVEGGHAVSSIRAVFSALVHNPPTR